MLTRISFVLMLTSLWVGTLYAADDTFCGKWMLNQQKSKMTGYQMKIEDLGNNKFKFDYGNGSYTVTADGTDQKIPEFGITVSFTKEGPNVIRWVNKKEGRVLSSSLDTLSADGNTYTIKGTSTKPDGTISNFDSTYKRVGSGSGWAGTWKETDTKSNSPSEFDISPYATHGLTFYSPAYKDTLSMNFDGKDYQENGPNVAPGSTSSGKRTNERTLEITDKVKEKVMDHVKYEVSPDGHTLTMTVMNNGQTNTQSYVYDKMK